MGSHTCFLRQGFSALADWGKRTARGVFVPYGRGVFAEPQRGSAPSADGGDVAAPAAVGKRVDTYGFYPLNSRFPLFLSLAKIGERRPLRKRGTAENLFYRRGAHCAFFFCSAQTKPRAYGDFPQTGNTKLCEKPPLRKNSVFSIINM